MSNFLKLLPLVLMAGLIGACDSGGGELDDYTRQVLARPAEPIEPIPPVRTYDPVPYTAADDRNPFLPITQDDQSPGENASTGDGPKPDPNRPKEYLERFSLDALAMVGTYEEGSQKWGLVADPDGVIHRVPVGNYMGQSYGRVTAIEESQITLRELIPDGNNGWLVRESAMALEDS